MLVVRSKHIMMFFCFPGLVADENNYDDKKRGNIVLFVQYFDLRESKFKITIELNYLSRDNITADLGPSVIND